MESEQMEMLTSTFREQLLALLEECARGRHGMFSEYPGDAERRWPEAEQLRELAVALQSILAQDNERNALCDEFLDLCTIHGEGHPGEPRLARVFLCRIAMGELRETREAA